MKRRLLLSLVPAAGLWGCTTPYQTAGLTGGYTDRKVNDNSYIVEFRGNGNTPEPMVWGFWFNRCAELTLEKGYSAFVVQRQEPGTQGRADEPGEPPRIRETATGGVIFIPGGTYTVTTYRAAAIVRMFRLDQFPSNQNAFDARRVIAVLADFVHSQGRQTLPDRQEMLKSTLVPGQGSPYRANGVRMEDLQKLLPAR